MLKYQLITNAHTIPIHSRAESVQYRQKFNSRSRAGRENELEAVSIVGARYCSIQGGIATQIQLTDAAGHYYQVPMSWNFSDF